MAENASLSKIWKRNAKGQMSFKEFVSNYEGFKNTYGNDNVDVFINYLNSNGQSSDANTNTSNQQQNSAITNLLNQNEPFFADNGNHANADNAFVTYQAIKKKNKAVHPLIVTVSVLLILASLIYTLNQQEA